MNKIETEFDKLKQYEDIETYYPSLKDVKEFLDELLGDRVESQKYIVRANKKIDQLTNNWNELEEWLNKIVKITANIDEKMTCKNILDKMKEIKEKNNE